MKKVLSLGIIACSVSALVVGVAQADTVNQKLKGKILLQVESKGEAWYVNPTDNKRYFLGRPADAFSVMRSLGLGITNSDLAKVKESGKTTSTATTATSTTASTSKKATSTPSTRKGTSTPPVMKNGTSTPPMKNGTSTPPFGKGEENGNHGLMMTITSINDSSLTATSMDRGNNVPGTANEATSSLVTYTINIDSSTTYYKDRATSTSDIIAVGSKAMVSGTVDNDAKTILANKIEVLTEDPGKMSAMD